MILDIGPSRPRFSKQFEGFALSEREKTAFIIIEQLLDECYRQRDRLDKLERFGANTAAEDISQT